MIKFVTQYFVVCDNSFCDAVICFSLPQFLHLYDAFVKSDVDFYSFDHQQQFERKIKKLGWKFRKKNQTDLLKIVCSNCLPFTSELEKRHGILRPSKKVLKRHFE